MSTKDSQVDRNAVVMDLILLAKSRQITDGKELLTLIRQQHPQASSEIIRSCVSEVVQAGLLAHELRNHSEEEMIQGVARMLRDETLKTADDLTNEIVGTYLIEDEEVEPLIKKAKAFNLERAS